MTCREDAGKAAAYPVKSGRHFMALGHLPNGLYGNLKGKGDLLCGTPTLWDLFGTGLRIKEIGVAQGFGRGEDAVYILPVMHRFRAPGNQLAG
jgi:hypothetical protein